MQHDDVFVWSTFLLRLSKARNIWTLFRRSFPGILVTFSVHLFLVLEEFLLYCWIGRTTPCSRGKCVLKFVIHHTSYLDKVKAAADTALEQYKQDHPEINEDEIKVDIPQVPALPAFRPLGGAAPGYWNMGLNMLFPGAGHALGMQQVLPGGPMGAWPRR